LPLTGMNDDENSKGVAGSAHGGVKHAENNL
jgi:hypothetical protein